MDRRTVVLGIAAAAAVTAAVTVAVTGRHHHTTRDDVAAYIRQVNAVQDELRYPLTKVLSAYHAFSTARTLTPAQARQLAAARRTLLAVRRRIAAIDAPPQARRLRALVLGLIAAEASVTEEVAGFVLFAPGFKAVLASVRSANARLSADLAQVHPPKSHALRGTKKQIKIARAAFAAASARAAGAQADAVSRYDAALAAAVRRLKSLTPPPAFAPTYRAQIRTLQATRTAGDRLAAELRKAKRTGVPALGRAFTNASRQSNATSAQLSEIASIKAYNARVRALGTAAVAVQGELTRLQRALP